MKHSQLNAMRQSFDSAYVMHINEATKFPTTSSIAAQHSVMAGVALMLSDAMKAAIEAAAQDAVNDNASEPTYQNVLAKMIELFADRDVVIDENDKWSDMITNDGMLHIIDQLEGCFGLNESLVCLVYDAVESTGDDDQEEGGEFPLVKDIVSALTDEEPPKVPKATPAVRQAMLELVTKFAREHLDSSIQPYETFITYRKSSLAAFYEAVKGIVLPNVTPPLITQGETLEQYSNRYVDLIDAVQKRNAPEK